MKKILLSFLIVLCCILPINVYAKEDTRISYTTYIGNGIYVETIIEDADVNIMVTNTVTKTKTKNYKNSSGKTLYSVSVTGTFNYTGSSATCTSSSIKVTVNDTTWKNTSKDASMSSNKATAKATMKQYLDGKLVQTTYPSVTLTCSATGVCS